MLFLNAVSEVCRDSDMNNGRQFHESRRLMQKFIPITPMEVMSMIVGGTTEMNSSAMIRISSCYMMFGDLEKAFSTFLKQTEMHTLAKRYGMKIKEKHSIIEPWPLRVTEKTTKELFDIRCSSSHTGCERYMEFEREEDV